MKLNLRCGRVVALGERLGVALLGRPFEVIHLVSGESPKRLKSGALKLFESLFSFIKARRGNLLSAERPEEHLLTKCVTPVRTAG